MALAANTLGTIKRVAVIGAGASGLTAIKEMLRQGFDVTAFEARPQVGGAWIYTPECPGECIVSFDADGRPFPQTKRAKDSPKDYPTILEPTPMYRLKANIPCDQMAFRGFPMTDMSGTFARDDEILKYLEDYAQDVLSHIRFNRLIKRIHKNSTGTNSQWTVESSDVSKSGSEDTTDHFDAICDCSGHYYQPHIPYTRDLWRYKRRILHAKWYRGPEAFSGQDVLIVGNSSSGYDMSREIAYHFQSQGSQKRVYQSMRHPVEVGIDPSANPPWATHLEAVAPIDYTTEDEVVLTDGRRLQVDTIIFGTGYLYSFPYYHTSDSPFDSHPLTKTPPLPQTCSKPDVANTLDFPDGGVCVHNLDNEYHIFYHSDPSLAFICLNRLVVPFPLAQTQAHVVAKYWAGTTFPLRASTNTAEDPTAHKYGFPKEHDVQDALLRAINEGGEPNGVEILADGTFPAVSTWRRENRPKCKAYRKEELGY